MKENNKHEGNNASIKWRRQERQVLEQVTWPPIESLVIRRKCQRVTANCNDTQNKENSFNVIPSNQSYSLKSRQENKLQSMENKAQESPRNKISVHDLDVNTANEKIHVDIIDTSTAFENLITPKSKWDESYFGSNEASTPNNDTFTRNSFDLEDHYNGTSLEYGFRHNDTNLFEEEEELVSILQSSMQYCGRQNDRLIKEPEQVVSGRENPAIPTEEIFQQNHLNDSESNVEHSNDVYSM